MSADMTEEAPSAADGAADALSQATPPDFPSKVCCDDLCFMTVILIFLLAVGIRFFAAEKRSCLIRNS
jgi:hypothetical protein